MQLEGGDIGHYSELFLQAMSRVVEVASQGGDYSSQFVYEMRALGWRERMRNLYRIKDKETGQFVFFKPNSFQDRFEEERSGRDIILKCRQVGFTTWSCIYALDRALWDGWNTGIMSHIRERTGMLFAIIKNANDWYKRDWGKYYLPVQEQDSSNGISWVESKASITVSYDFRGLTLRFLHVSEAGFIESERLIGSMQAVPEAGEIILESTPNGSGGMYYNQWNLWKKEGDLAPFKGYFCAWHQHYPEHPERWINKEIKLNEKELELKELYGLENYHLAWRRWKINESCDGSEEVFDVEYPSDDISCFLSGSDQVFASKTLKLQESFVKDPSFVGVLRSEGKKKVSFYGGKMIAVLGGTGGGRDTWKRRVMGAIADEYCEEIILTNEDPYDEDPEKIVAEIKEGITKHSVKVIMDRREAIRDAIHSAKKYDVVLITGKGTDPYIMGPNGTKEVWDDATVAREELNTLFNK